MRWLMNTSKYTADVQSLCAGWIGRELVIGPPQATPFETVERLEAMAAVGIYEQQAGHAPTDDELPGDGR